MGNKKKCDNPYNSHGSRVLGKHVDEAFIERVKKNQPNVDWSQVTNLCFPCKKQAESQEQLVMHPTKIRKIDHNRSDGVSLSVTEQNDALPENVHSDDENSLHAASDHGYALGNPGMEIRLDADNFTQSSRFSSGTDQGTSEMSQSTEGSYVGIAKQNSEIHELNVIMENCGLMTINKRVLYKPNELRKLYHDLVSALEKKFEGLFVGESSLELERYSECSYCESLFHEFAEKYKDIKQRSEQYKILTSLPGRYNAKQVAEVIGCSHYMALKAVALRIDRGVFSAPDPREGKKLATELVDLVKAFYLDPSHSRPSPRANDTIKGPDGNRLAKHHMLLNQRDLFALFKNDHPDKKISLTSFLSLCPRECSWPWYKPFHNVCLCITHQNFKMQYEAVRGPLNFEDFMKEIFCNPLKAECALGLCVDCPKMERIAHLFHGMNGADLLQFKQWTRQDGTNFEILVSPVDDFIDKFERDIMKYIEHDFINEKQKKAIMDIKRQGLKNQKTLLVQVDFAQNYSMVVQDSVYGFHWSNKQATLHPFSVTWWDNETNSLMEKNYVVISDCLDHDANVFNSFKRKIIAQIKNDFNEFDPKHIIYLSDGAGGQYKNKKNMAHLMEHFKDFNMTAEWIFTASSHGKGPCDRVAAIVKRTTRVHSLRPGVIITSAKQMYDFCVTKLQSDKMVFVFITNEEVEAELDLFTERYSEFKKAIPGTRMFHQFIPLADRKLALYKYSGEEDPLVFDFRKDTTPLVDPNDLEITHFYCFVEAAAVQVGMLVDIDEDEVEFQCMRINKGNKRCRWPAIAVSRRVIKLNVILHLQEPLYNGDGYFELLPDELAAIKERFKIHKQRF